MWIKVLSKPCLQFKIVGEAENNSSLGSATCLSKNSIYEIVG